MTHRRGGLTRSIADSIACFCLALCRADGKLLSQTFKKYFPESAIDGNAGPRLIALAKENLDTQIREYLPSIAPHPVYLHQDRTLYKMLGVKKLGFFDLLSWSMMKKFNADKTVHGGNMKGEGMVKGAVIVLGTKEQGIIETVFEEFGKVSHRGKKRRSAEIRSLSTNDR